MTKSKVYATLFVGILESEEDRQKYKDIDAFSSYSRVQYTFFICSSRVYRFFELIENQQVIRNDFKIEYVLYFIYVQINYAKMKPELKYKCNTVITLFKFKINATVELIYSRLSLT